MSPSNTIPFGLKVCNCTHREVYYEEPFKTIYHYVLQCLTIYPHCLGLLPENEFNRLQQSLLRRKWMKDVQEQSVTKTPKKLANLFYSMSNPVATIVTAKFNFSESSSFESYRGRSIRLKHVCERGYMHICLSTLWIVNFRTLPSFP